MIKKELTVLNRLGLHPRAIAKFACIAFQYKDTNIVVEREGRRVDGKSIMGINMLAAPWGSTIIVYAEGAEEKEAIDALENLVTNRFGEPE